MLAVPTFQGAEPTHNYLQTLPKILHTLIKFCARTFHTLLAISGREFMREREREFH